MNGPFFLDPNSPDSVYDQVPETDEMSEIRARHVNVNAELKQSAEDLEKRKLRQRTRDDESIKYLKRKLNEGRY